MKWDPNCVITSNSSTRRGLPEHMEWLRISQLNDMELPVYSTFFADKLLDLASHAKHIVTYKSAD